MKNLLNILLRNSPWLVGILLVAISFYFVFTYNSYQRSVYLTSANRVTGSIYELVGEVSRFVYLKKDNRELLEKNAALQQEIFALQHFIQSCQTDSLQRIKAFTNDSLQPSQYRLLPAQISSMSISSLSNFITINKGYKHGVKPDMGVISLHGVIGIVFKTSNYFSVIIPVINPKFRLSAKINNSENFGSIMWNGKDATTVQLTELPKHELFHKGDTVVTSFSNIFPKGIVIGYVTDKGYSKEDNFNTFDVRLATDFHSLKNVFIVQNSRYKEQQIIEREASK